MRKNEVKIKLKTLVILIMILLLIIMAILGLLIANNKENKQDSQGNIITDHLNDKEEQQENTIKEEQDVSNELDMSFMKLENSEQNMIYSPLSIKCALKMLSDGASGNTKVQIDNLIKKLNLTKYENIEEKLSFANGIYIRDDYSKFIKQTFKERLIEEYNAEVNYDSFDNATNVNNWIERKTLGIIKNMLRDNQVQDPDCKMVLINALAIDMAWEMKFDMNDTSGSDFYLADGTRTNATTMNIKTKSDEISYYKDNNITALTMNLEKSENTKLEFMAIMPEKNDLKEYIKTLTINEINDISNKSILASKNKDGIKISIPKFAFEYDLQLKEDLIDLGITDAFNPRNADFSNMSDEKLCLSEALHKADIEFTEEGVKAAAVTVFTMLKSEAFIEERKPEEIKIYKPFMFLIRDKDTKEIWFVGTVYEPNSWEDDRAEYQR